MELAKATRRILICVDIVSSGGPLKVKLSPLGQIEVIPLP